MQFGVKKYFVGKFLIDVSNLDLKKIVYWVS